MTHNNIIPLSVSHTSPTIEIKIDKSYKPRGNTEDTEACEKWRAMIHGGDSYERPGTAKRGGGGGGRREFT